MTEQRRPKPDGGPPAKMVTDGMDAAVGKIIDRAAEPMLRTAPKMGRIVLKSIPGAPGLLMDVVEFAKADDKGRKLAGVGGGAIGGLAGGALGAATGPAAPIAAPLGAATGSVAGERIAEELYDDHAAAVGRTIRGGQEDVLRGIDRTRAWMKKREQEIARGLVSRIQPYMLPPQAHQRY